MWTVCAEQANDGRRNHIGGRFRANNTTKSKGEMRRPVDGNPGRGERKFKIRRGDEHKETTGDQRRPKEIRGEFRFVNTNGETNGKASGGRKAGADKGENTSIRVKDDAISLHPNTLQP